MHSSDNVNFNKDYKKFYSYSKVDQIIQISLDWQGIKRKWPAGENKVFETPHQQSNQMGDPVVVLSSPHNHSGICC